MKRLVLSVLAVTLWAAPQLQSQMPTVVPIGGKTSAVPNLMKFSGVARGVNGKALTGVLGVTFSLYKDEQGGSALWMETQNVQADASGHYSVSLGTEKSLPVELFSSGEARWLGVQVAGQAETNRVLLLSVPYALKAADAATVGGLPPSAFVLAAPPSWGNGAAAGATSGAVSPALGGTGKTNFLPIWTNASTLGSSAIFQVGTGATAKVGIGNTTPATALDVTGGSFIRGTLGSPSTGTATATRGFNSNPHDFTASVFNTSAAVSQTFRLQAEPAGNHTAAASGTLNLLYGAGTAVPSETGLKISSKGLITFATGQTFPGLGTITGVTAGSGLSGGGTTGNVTLSLLNTCAASQVLQWNGTAWACATVSGSGTITGVTAGVGLTGGGTSGNVTLNLNTATTDARYAQLAAANTFTQPLTVNGTQQTLLHATSSATSASVIYGHSTDTSAFASEGVLGIGDGPNSLGVFGSSNGANGIGVEAKGNLNGVLGFSGTSSTIWNAYSLVGVHGDTGVAGGIGVLGTVDAGYGGAFINNDPSSAALVVQNNETSGFANLIAAGSGASALNVFMLDTSGNLSISGNISKAGGSFKIDHPLDPSNKYLYHSFVESPDMMNIYNGTVLLDADGKAQVALPDWFEALNRDFRYQLTAIGAPGPNLYISQEVTSNHFEIAGGKPGAKVSWQVTGVRHDAWADAHRIPLEVEKAGAEKGKYLHPELFGMPTDKFGMTSHSRLRQDSSSARR